MRLDRSAKGGAGWLDRIELATPCSMDWDAMKGDARVRFCGACHLNVYNLSALTRLQAEELITKREGRLCVRFLRRADGTVLTQDCPVGLAAVVRQRTVAAMVWFFALLGLGSAVGYFTREPKFVWTKDMKGGIDAHITSRIQ